MRKALSYILSAAMALLPVLSATPAQAQAQNPPSNQSFVGGRFVARNYLYPGVAIAPGTNIPAGAGTISLNAGSVRLQDGRTIVPFSAGGFNIMGQPGAFQAIPITVGAGAAKETVTPTAVSGCYVGAPQGSCKITATFVNAHGQGEVVVSGSAGIQEAANDAAFYGGGLVVADSSLSIVGGGLATVRAAILAAKPYFNVAIEDDLQGVPQYWNPQGGATTLAAPATLIAATAGFGVNGASALTGTYTGSSNYVTCIAYVDALGQEGPCSATFTIATSGVAATNQIGYTAPAASAGAVGYTIYISLAAGSYTLAYKVPLVSQPSVIGTYPASSSVCTLTPIETVTPACALTNTNYGQTGVGAVVTALTLNTSPIPPQSTIISTTSVYVPNPGGRTTLTYAPGAHLGASGLTSTLAYTIGVAAATVVPDVIGTIHIPPNFMNVVGKTLQICGEATSTATAATIVDIQFQWDAVGQNTAGKGVLIGDLTATPAAALATTGHASFCADFQTTVASATATGGSINHIGASGAVGGLTLVAPGAFSDCVTPGAIGSLNLAVDARINIIYLHTTATDGAGWTLQNVSAKLI